MTSPAALLGIALLAGCANLRAPAPPAALDAESVACARWFDALDATVDRAGVRDAEADRIDGFGGLRVDRFSASLGARAATSATAFAAWLARLQQLEDEGRAVELGNLPRTAFPIDGAADAAAAASRSRACSQRWNAPLHADAALRATLLERAQVPDRYATWQRAIGLYPLVRWPFFGGVQAWQRRHEEAMSRWSAQPPPTQRFTATGAALPPAAMAAWWRARPRDALGVPRFTPAEVAFLLAAYAPALEIQAQGDFDRFGRLAWGAGQAPAVDTDQPVLYQRLAHMRYRDRVLVQLVYSLWFPERPEQGPLDILAGTLDAVVLLD